MRRGIDRRLVLAGLLPIASCAPPVRLPAFHFRTTNESREPFFEAIRAFARDEGFTLRESRGALGTIGVFTFILIGWRTRMIIGSDIDEPIATFGDFNNQFRVDIASTQEPMPWALHEAGLRALAGRLQAALIAVPDVQVFESAQSRSAG